MSIIKLIRIRFGLALKPYYFVRTSRPVLSVLDRKSIKLFLKSSVKVSELQKRIINDLKNKGIAITSIDELFPGSNYLTMLQNEANELLSQAPLGRKKTFLKYAWNNHPMLDLTNSLVRISLEPLVLTIVNSYLGLYSKFNFFSINTTVPKNAGSDSEGSQRWHRDPGVNKICKMFIYLSDVDEIGAGPFIYLTESNCDGKYSKLFPTDLYGRLGIYPPADKLESSITNKDIKQCLGKAGTVVFCDTLGLHKGGYSVTKPRVMTTSAYEAPSAIGGVRFKYPQNLNKQIRGLKPEAQLALMR